MNHINIAKLNVRHLGCKHGFLSTQHSKPPIKNIANCIFTVNRQIFDLPIILCIWYICQEAFDRHRQLATVPVVTPHNYYVM